MQDWDLICPLLLTSTSLQVLRISLNDDWHDAFLTACARYLSSATTLQSLGVLNMNKSLSEAVFTSFYNGVADSSLRKLTLSFRVATAANVEAVVKRLALAFAESSFEEVVVGSEICLVLSHTTPVKDLDFAFSWTESPTRSSVHRLQINRKWKHI